MYDVLDVARTIINLHHEIEQPLTNMNYLKLMRVMYLAQARFLVNNFDNPLFEDDILVTSYGPVIKRVVIEFDHNALLEISKVKKIYVPINKDFPISIWNMQKIPYVSKISEDDRELLKEIVTDLEPCSSAHLLEGIMQHDIMVKYYEKGEQRVLPKEEIYNYFKKLNEEISPTL